MGFILGHLVEMVDEMVARNMPLLKYVNRNKMSVLLLVGAAVWCCRFGAAAGWDVAVWRCRLWDAGGCGRVQAPQMPGLSQHSASPTSDSARTMVHPSPIQSLNSTLFTKLVRLEARCFCRGAHRRSGTWRLLGCPCITSCSCSTSSGTTWGRCLSSYWCGRRCPSQARPLQPNMHPTYSL